MSALRRRVLIVAFDGLRPDMVTPQAMPSLCAFAAAGVRFTGSRVAFPTETRVNQASLVTGTWPERHGIVGNRFFDPAADPVRLINTGDEDQLRAADQKLAGALLDAPSMGEILAAAGHTLAVIGSGTAGGTRMLHHQAERLGQFRLSLYRPDASTPRREVGRLIERLGPIPEAVVPAIARTSYAVDAYLQYVEPELAPDVAVLWSFEPDVSYHYSGIGTSDNLAALRHADGELARILAWRASLPPQERPHVVTLSDHGHLATEGEPLRIVERLRAAGFAAGTSFEPGVDAAVFCQRAGGIYVRDRNRGLVGRIVDWLGREPWCELAFARDVPGALPLSAARVDHRRAPDVVFVTQSHDGPNAAGLPGRCAHDAPGLPVEGGMHGGLHPLELRNWLAAHGEGLAQRRVVATPAGIVDVLPTVLDLLGLEIPASVEGRVLRDLHSAGEASAPVERERVSAGGLDGGAGVFLERSRYRGRIYLEQGRRSTG